MPPEPPPEGFHAAQGPLTVTRHGTGRERAGNTHRRWDTSPGSPRLVFTIRQMDWIPEPGDLTRTNRYEQTATPGISTQDPGRTADPAPLAAVPITVRELAEFGVIWLHLV
jgi:hypothetical protein